MTLPFLNHPNPKREYLFALQIGHGQVQGAVWAVINNRPQVIAVGSSVAWDDSSADSLVTASDQSLSDAGNHLDPQGKTQPEKIILGLLPDWLETEKIHPAKVNLLRPLFDKLALKPVGYVVIPEATVRFLQSQENAPPTAILLGFWAGYLEVSLVRLGKITGTHTVRRSPKLTDDVIEGISRLLPTDMLPSRILLYNSSQDLESIRQQLLSHPWQSPQTRLPFLHFPKVESLPQDFVIRAIALAGGSEVAQAIGLITTGEETSLEISPDQLGFSPGVNAPNPNSPPSPSIPPPPKNELSPASKRFTLPKLKLPQFKLPSFTISWPTLPRLGLVFWGIGIITILAALVLATLYLPSAKVELQISPLDLSTEFDTTGSFVQTSASDSKSAPTTGSKVVGEPASGSVTIINGTSTVKNLPAGTLLTSPTSLKFTTDSSVLVASASGTADPNSYQPGRVTVKITASQIGSDGNLTAGTEFRVGTYPQLDVVAKNEAALSGGSSREARVVAQEDISQLKSTLMSQLREALQAKITEELTPDQILVPDTFTSQTTSEELNHKTGDEANEITYKLTLKAQSPVVSRSNLEELVQQKLQDQIPDNYQLGQLTNYRFSVRGSTGSENTVFTNVSARFTPQVDSSQIVSQIAGKNIAWARNHLNSYPGVTGAQITYSLPLPDPIVFLPRLPGHITVSIQTP